MLRMFTTKKFISQENYAEYMNKSKFWNDKDNFDGSNDYNRPNRCLAKLQVFFISLNRLIEPKSIINWNYHLLMIEA